MFNSFKDVFKILIFFNWSNKIIAHKLGDYVNKNKFIIYRKAIFREESY